MVSILLASTVTPAQAFDFKAELFDPLPTLGAEIVSVDTGTGEVSVNGGDGRAPTITPFDVDWGDGSPVDSSWFPFAHTYTDTTQNYVVQITAHYDEGDSASIRLPLRFVAPVLAPLELPEQRTVFIDNAQVTLQSRPFPGYPAPELGFFDDSFFPIVPRAAVEYVLHLAAELQFFVVDYDVLYVNGAFQQHVLRDPGAGGMYSLWFTDPVAFGAADYAFQGTIQYSSFFHEMGHNVTLNFPEAYHYGGRIDGWANAIYSETLAQIFQHYTAYAIINNWNLQGLEELLALEIEESARSSMRVVRSAYDAYLANGAPFTAWNDPMTAEDETFGSFMTLAFKFFEHAENFGDDYWPRMKRLSEYLGRFDPAREELYAAWDDSEEADMRRSTYMVAALSHAFEEDLRPEMQALNFPIDDELYEGFLGGGECLAQMGISCPPSHDPNSFVDGLDVQINGGVGAPFPCRPVVRIGWDWGDGSSSDSFFPASHTYPERSEYLISVSAYDDQDTELATASCTLSLERIFDSSFEDG